MFPRVGFAPEGSYFGPLTSKVRFVESPGGHFLDLGSGFSGVGLAPEGLYFCHVASKVHFFATRIQTLEFLEEICPRQTVHFLLLNFLLMKKLYSPGRVEWYLPTYTS